MQLLKRILTWICGSPDLLKHSRYWALREILAKKAGQSMLLNWIEAVCPGPQAKDNR